MILVRYRLEARPAKASPFRRGWEMQPNGIRRKVWVSAWRRVFGHGGGRYGLRPAPKGGRALLTEAELRAARKVYARLGWHTRATPVELRRDRWPNLRGDLDANPALLDALNRVGKRLGKIIDVREGKRSRAEQEYLYALYLSGRGNLAARPGTSRHETGDAADCGVDGVDIGDYPGAAAACVAEGLGAPVPGEDWHLQLGDSTIGFSS